MRTAKAATKVQALYFQGKLKQNIAFQIITVKAQPEPLHNYLILFNAKLFRKTPHLT